MEKYIVSARKYRPASFDTLVGQQTLAHTLKTAIGSQRLAHAYLFCGPRGVGKTSCARIFAKTINCTNPTAQGEACGECESCRAFKEGRSYNIMELDAASNNSVDDIRDLTDQVRIPPPVGKYRVYIIDEVHMLSQAAFNAFLKTLEEPPAHAIFILATTEKHKVIPTILSRCQIYDFTRIHVPDIVAQLRRICDNEGITADNAALNIIAQKADGAMRDALSIFDQVAASSQGNITYQSALESLNVLDYGYYFRLVDAFLKCDVPQTLLIYKDIRDHGFDSLVFINGVAQHLRDLMVSHDEKTVKLLEKSDDIAAQYVAQAKSCTAQWLYRAMDLCNRCDLDYRITNNKQFIVELTLIKLCQILNPEPTAPDSGLKKISTSVTAPAAPAPVAQQATVAPQATVQASTLAPVVRPVAKPAVAAAKPTPSMNGATPRIGMTPSININQQAAAPKQADALKTQTVPEPAQVKPITTDSWDKAWNAFIEENSAERLLVNVMNTSPAKRKGDSSTFVIEVDNTAVMEIMNQHIANVVNYMRNKLSNPDILIEVAVKQGTMRTIIRTPEETIAEMMTQNPTFKAFVGRFKLGIA